MEAHELRERRTNRLLYLAFAALVIVVVVVAVPKVAEGRVKEYDLQAKRDPKTGYLAGMGPRELGPENSPRAVLFVHGFSGSPSNYNDLPDALARDGWRVRCMVTPGHGTSPYDFEATTGDEMLEGVLKELRALKATHEKVVIVGHSLGGALVTLAVAREPVDAAILCAPFFGLTIDETSPISVRQFADVASPWLRWIPRDENSEPVAFAPNRKHINSYKWISGEAGVTALGVGDRVYSEGAIDKMTCPVLLIHSLADHVNSPKASAAAFERFPSVDKRAVWLKKSDHVIFWDYERLETTFEVRVFLDKVFG